jgi:hypothetical protein
LIFIGSGIEKHLPIALVVGDTGDSLAARNGVEVGGGVRGTATLD